MAKEACGTAELLLAHVVETHGCAKLTIGIVVPNHPKLALSVSDAE